MVTAEAVRTMGTAADAERLRPALEPYSGMFAVMGTAAMSVGPIDRSLALLDATLGRVGDARSRLPDVVAQARAGGMEVWARQAEHDLARLNGGLR